jgi:DNA-binding MarR family transcriptional regulator
MNKINLWPDADEARHALGARYEPAMDKAAKQAGLGPTEYGVLMTALTLDPTSVASWRLRVRGPYTAAGRYEERLRKAAQLGYLKATREGEYRLTELGRRTVRNIMDAAYKAMSRLAPMASADLDRLALLSRRIVDASEAAPEPPGKWSIHLSRRLDPGEGAHVVVRIDHSLSDLNAYRDDSHLAAWRSYDLSGAAWEALTNIWRDEAKSLDALVQSLERRGHSREDYAEALNDLVQRGLITEGSAAYRVTKQGQKLRQEAEDKTDEYFYAPWQRLSSREITDLRRLLRQLRDGLAKRKA